jgi:hypothetical protein
MCDKKKSNQEDRKAGMAKQISVNHSWDPWVPD